MTASQELNRYENVNKTGINKNSEAGRYILPNQKYMSTIMENLIEDPFGKEIYVYS